MKTLYRRRMTHVSLEPLHFTSRLAALMSKPRVNPKRFHGVSAPNTRHCGRVTPGKWGRGGRQARTVDPEETTVAERRAAMTWAQRLKRVFGTDVKTCPTCGAAMRIIAGIEAPMVIEKILNNLEANSVEVVCSAGSHLAAVDLEVLSLDTVRDQYEHIAR